MVTENPLALYYILRTITHFYINKYDEMTYIQYNTLHIFYLW